LLQGKENRKGPDEDLPSILKENKKDRRGRDGRVEEGELSRGGGPKGKEVYSKFEEFNFAPAVGGTAL